MKEFFGTIFCTLLGAVGVFVIAYCLDSCFSSYHEVSESSPDYRLHMNDIQYKGHTYIYVRGSYSRSIVHAAHCKCNQKK